MTMFERRLINLEETIDFLEDGNALEDKVEEIVRAQEIYEFNTKNVIKFCSKCGALDMQKFNDKGDYYDLCCDCLDELF